MLLPLLLSLAVITAQGQAVSQPASNPRTDAIQNTTPALSEEARYQILLRITQGNAKLMEVIQLLSNTDDVAALTNTLHALYSMRWHRGVNNLLDDLWQGNHNKYPSLAWPALEKIPARIALASTLNRIRIYNTDEYKDFIHAHQYDEHEFHRAQVAVSLGLNGDPADVPYLKEMAESDNIYVAQSAITALGLLVHPQSKEALMALAKKYQGDERGKLIREVFTKVYPVQ